MNKRQQMELIGDITGNLMAGQNISSQMSSLLASQSREQDEQTQWLLDSEKLPEVVASRARRASREARRLADRAATLALQAQRRATR